MEVYVGIDDHASTCVYGVIDERGNVVMDGVVKTELEALRRMLKALDGRKHVVLENGTRAAWLYHGLRDYCEDIMVANLCGVGKYRNKDKSDRLDALELARLRRAGVLKPIYQHNRKELQVLKQAVRGYEQIVQDITRCKNRIKAVYRSVGINCTGGEVYQKSRRKRWLNKLKPLGHRRRAKQLMEQLDVLLPLKKNAQKEMTKQARKQKKEYAILRSVDGIGTVWAAQLLGHIGTPARIHGKRALWRMSGLAVISRSSADYVVVDHATGEVVNRRRVHTHGLNQDYNRTLKAIFKAAALQAIRKGGVFKEHYEQRIKRGMRPEMARLTIARKLSATTLSCWQKGEMFDPDKLSLPRV